MKGGLNLPGAVSYVTLQSTAVVVSPVPTPTPAGLPDPIVTNQAQAGLPPEGQITIPAGIFPNYYLRIIGSADGVTSPDGTYTTQTFNCLYQLTPSDFEDGISEAELIAEGYIQPAAGPWFSQYRFEREDGVTSNFVVISGDVIVLDGGYVEGDSNTSPSYSDVNDWFADNPGVTHTNAAVGGSDTNDIVNRRAAVVTAKPELVIIGSGTNDLLSYASAQAFFDDWFTRYIAPNRADLPGVKHAFMTLPPKNPATFPGFNARRAELATVLRAEVAAGRLDFILNRGENPNCCKDSDAPGTYFDAAGVHLTIAGHQLTKVGVAAGLEAWLADIQDVTPDAPSFTNVVNADESTEYSQQNVVTGIEPGAEIIGSMTGNGTIERNNDSAGTGNLDLMVGDFVTSRLTSAGAPATALTQVLSLADQQATFSVETAAAAGTAALSPSVTAIDAANVNYSSSTLSRDIVFEEGFHIVCTHSSGRRVTGVTIGGVAATLLIEGSTGSTDRHVAWWWIPSNRPAATHTVVMTGAGTLEYAGMQGYTWTGATATIHDTCIRSYGSGSNPYVAGDSLQVDTDGQAACACSCGATADVVWNNGTRDYSVNVATRYFSAARFDATATPSMTVAQFSAAGMVGVSFTL